MAKKHHTALVCYCCGKEIGNRFALCSAAVKPDRLFPMRLECLPRADVPGGTIVKVRRTG